MSHDKVASGVGVGVAVDLDPDATRMAESLA